MDNVFSAVSANLAKLGYDVHVFDTAESASAWIDSEIDGCSVGFGGSETLREMGLYERLARHNEVYWHHILDKGLTADETRIAACRADIYLSSVNGLSENGEIINIDGVGNRLAGTLFGHEKVYFVIGRNKLAPDYEKAVWRARNVAGPHRAQQLGKKTPCAVKADRCYDCKSPDRVCNAMVTLWGPMTGMETEILLVDEDLGL